jgi:hypothetical protein
MKETVDHGEIRAWAERHGGKPQVYDNPRAGSDRVGIRVDFPGTADEEFSSGPSAARDISWEEFFTLFDRLGLSFEYEQDIEEPAAVADRSTLYRFGKRMQVP